MAFDVYTEISEEGRRNVVSAGYLHSTTFNFKNAVAGGLETSRFHIGEDYYSKVEKSLENIKNKLLRKENQFYKIFGISGGDSATNAYRFNQLLRKSMERFETLKRLTSDSFYKFIDQDFVNQIQTFAQFFKKKCYDNNIPIEDIIEIKDVDSFLNQALNLINAIYTWEFSGAGKRKLRTAITSDGKINKNLKVRFNKVFQEYIKIESRKIQEKRSIDLKKRIISFLNPDDEFRRIIEKSFDEIKDRMNLSILEQNNTIGIIGEIDASILIDLMLDKMADKAPKSFYVGDLRNADKKQSPIDFLIGKYGIQVKNTSKNLFDTTGIPFYDIHVQSSLSLDTFIGRLDVNADEYRYLVANVMWLRNNGMDKNGKEDKLNMSDIPQILEYINGIISQAAEELFSTKAQDIFDKSGKKVATSYGNTFFLLKGEYLIPISVMIDGIIATLREENQRDTSGIGYFDRNTLWTTNKKNKQASLTSSTSIANANMIKEEKRDAISQIGDNFVAMNYPEPLLGVGSKYGQEIISNTNINIKYKFVLENLNKIENNLRIW